MGDLKSLVAAGAGLGLVPSVHNLDNAAARAGNDKKTFLRHSSLPKTDGS